MALRDTLQSRLYKFVEPSSQDYDFHVSETRKKSLLFTAENGLVFCPAFASTSGLNSGGLATCISVPKNIVEFEYTTLLSAFGREVYEDIHKWNGKEGSFYIGSGVIMDDRHNILVLGGEIKKYDADELKWYTTGYKISISYKVFSQDGTKLEKFIAKEFSSALANNIKNGMYMGRGLRGSLTVCIEDMKRYETSAVLPLNKVLGDIQNCVQKCLLNQIAN